MSGTVKYEKMAVTYRMYNERCVCLELVSESVRATSESQPTSVWYHFLIF